MTVSEQGDHLGPFLTGFNPIDQRPMGAVAARDRIEMVKGFTAAQCQAALRVADLQQSVRDAIERRLRELERR